jgi:hypothetical protein
MNWENKKKTLQEKRNPPRRAIAIPTNRIKIFKVSID